MLSDGFPLESAARYFGDALERQSCTETTRQESSLDGDDIGPDVDHRLPVQRLLAALSAILLNGIETNAI